MLSVYDLYDLYAIYIRIRAYPDYPLNLPIIEQVSKVLRQRDENCQPNQFRTALSSIDGLDAERYGFAFVQNAYVYMPQILKDEKVCDLLLTVNESLCQVLREGNAGQIVALTDCIHNLPIDLAEHHCQVPKYFWKGPVRTYRAAWDKHFLKQYQ